MWAAWPQTDGRTLWILRGERYLQVHKAEMEGGRGPGIGPEEREQIQVSRTAKGRGTKREARAEPGCAKRQASTQKATRVRPLRLSQFEFLVHHIHAGVYP